MFYLPLEYSVVLPPYKHLGLNKFPLVIEGINFGGNWYTKTIGTNIKFWNLYNKVWSFLQVKIELPCSLLISFVNIYLIQQKSDTSIPIVIIALFIIAKIRKQAKYSLVYYNEMWHPQYLVHSPWRTLCYVKEASEGTSTTWCYFKKIYKKIDSPRERK